MDPDQTAPIEAVWSGSTLFAIEASWTFQQITFVAIGALRVKALTGHILQKQKLFFREKANSVSFFS